MKATLVTKRRVTVDEWSFADIVIWELPKPLRGSAHAFKYRLAYVVRGTCVLRYDNEAGKGDHIHRGEQEERYGFTTREALLGDFWSDVGRLRS